MGTSKEDYTLITYDMTLHFAEVLAAQNRQMTFVYVSGAGTDSTEKGRLMWARVKGRTENALTRLPFKRVYNFRPGFMRAIPGQQHTLKAYKYLSWLYPILKFILPNAASELSHVARTMIRCVMAPTERSVVEVSDINRMGTEEQLPYNK